MYFLLCHLHKVYDTTELCSAFFPDPDRQPRTMAELLSPADLNAEHFNQQLVNNELVKRHELINNLKNLNINSPISIISSSDPNIIFSGEDNSIMARNLQTNEIILKLTILKEKSSSLEEKILDIAHLKDGRLIVLSGSTNIGYDEYGAEYRNRDHFIDVYASQAYDLRRPAKQKEVLISEEDDCILRCFKNCALGDRSYLPNQQ